MADYIMEVVQQTQTIVENVQTEAISMYKHERMMAQATASVLGDRPSRPEMNDGAMGPKDTPVDVVHDSNLIDVLLSCHPLFEGASVIKLAATMLIMTIYTMHGVNI